MSIRKNVRVRFARGSLAALLAIAGLGLTAGSASAAQIEFAITLDQTQVFPSPQSVEGAQGFGSVIVNTDTNEISWDISFAEISGDAVGAHFHGPAQPGELGDIMIDVAGISGFGTNLVGTTEVSAELLDQLLSGAWYFNVHTELNPSGEIRGQVLAK